MSYSQAHSGQPISDSYRNSQSSDVTQVNSQLNPSGSGSQQHYTRDPVIGELMDRIGDLTKAVQASADSSLGRSA